MILGLTGRMAAGKGTVADYLKGEGFQYYSLSDAIRAELRERGIPESRASLTEVGNDLRASHGPGALAIRILQELDPSQDHIVDSIRNPAEVDALRESGIPFVLICVEAALETRYERLRARDRVGDVDSLDAFRAQEERELQSADPSTQQLLATEAKADRSVSNDGDVTALHEEMARVLASLA